ncbi:MAG: phosphoribosyltransferase [Bryobacterales bacterium]|nr:phosphoribosyltransferase [Bryobacterales bacterium]
MELIPTQDEVIHLLRETGALRDGFFQFPDGLYSNQYLQMALAFRNYQHLKTLSVGLSRKVRANPEIRAIVSQLSIVTLAVGGLPVAYGVCEALRAKRVYWAERDNSGDPLRYRPFIDNEPGEKVLIVDDILRSGKKLRELRRLVEAGGGEVVGLAVVVYQPNPEMVKFDDLPFYYLAQLDSIFKTADDTWPGLKPGMEPTAVWQG